MDQAPLQILLDRMAISVGGFYSNRLVRTAGNRKIRA